MILYIFSDRKGFDRPSPLVRDKGQGIGNGIGAQGQAPGGGNVGLAQHLEKDLTHQVHALRIHGRRFAIEVVIASPPRDKGKGWIIAVTE